MLMITQTRTLWLFTTLITLTLMARQGLPTLALSAAGSGQPMAPSLTKVALRHAGSSDAFRPPQPTNLQEIREALGYPEPARKAGIEGQVILRVWVDESGRYVRHEVEESNHPLLHIPCELFAPYLDFRPALTRGEPVPGTVAIPFTFRLSDMTE
ncbi:MAG: TonB family protein [Bacteroidetes bacterium]|nr:MAG: TonB family protein [Bacteroidota bacterium]